MKLLFAQPSPFARKVIVAAHELGLFERLTLIPAMVTPVSPNDQVLAANPLSKIPTLVLDDGQALFDSRVIVDYLDSLTDKALAPRSGMERWRVLAEAAQADGLMDAALLARYEAFLRPESLRWDEWSAGQLGKVRRALDVFEGSERMAGGAMNIADIGLACALGYLDFRFPNEGWREGRPRLAAFYETVSAKPYWAPTHPEA